MGESIPCSSGEPSRPVTPASSQGCESPVMSQHLKPPKLLAEDLEKSGGASAPDDSHILHDNPGGPHPLGLAFMVADVDTSEAEPSGVDTHG